VPLTDEDRLPWLESLGQHINQWSNHSGAVLACSALNETYRKILQTVPDIQWIFLEGTKELIRARLESRKGHFMNPLLLDSQFETLEKPDYGLAISIAQDPTSIVNEILLNLEPRQNQSEYGIMGMGVVAKSLALKLAGDGDEVSIYNGHLGGVEGRVARLTLRE